MFISQSLMQQEKKMLPKKGGKITSNQITKVPNNHTDYRDGACADTLQMLKDYSLKTSRLKQHTEDD